MEFLHQPKKKYTDYNAVTKEIQAVTEKEASGKTLSTKPINLHLYSPHGLSFIPFVLHLFLQCPILHVSVLPVDKRTVLQLSLVDLPGMVKMALPGQPPDIEKQVSLISIIP